MAEAYNLPMSPHGRGIVSAHCVASTPNGMFVEFFDANQYTNTTIRAFQEETGRLFLPDSIRPVKGWVDLPKVPGLGLDPDLNAVEEYRDKYGKVTSEVTRKTSRPINHNLFLSL